MSIDNERLLLVPEGQWDVSSACSKCQKWLKIKHAIYSSLGIQNANTLCEYSRKNRLFRPEPTSSVWNTFSAQCVDRAVWLASFAIWKTAFIWANKNFSLGGKAERVE